jgi:hypothetical protein
MFSEEMKASTESLNLIGALLGAKLAKFEEHIRQWERKTDMSIAVIEMKLNILIEDMKRREKKREKKRSKR